MNKLAAAVIASIACFPVMKASHPVESLLERIDPGASSKILVEQTDTPTEYFEITSRDGKPLIKGNSPVNIAAGLNWYLKYYPHIHLSWNQMSAPLPEVLPVPAEAERHETYASQRYYLNYCTHS